MALGKFGLDVVPYSQPLVFGKGGTDYTCDDHDAKGGQDPKAGAHLDEYVEFYKGYCYKEEQKGTNMVVVPIVVGELVCICGLWIINWAVVDVGFY